MKNYTFGSKSKARLKTCHPDLVKLANMAITYVDFSVIYGHRTEDEQNKIYKQGYSQLQWPESKHNYYPSHAIDFMPYPVNWNDRERFTLVGSVFKGLSIAMDIPIIWGGDWDNDGELADNNFDDLGHIELDEEYYG